MPSAPLVAGGAGAGLLRRVPSVPSCFAGAFVGGLLRHVLRRWCLLRWSLLGWRLLRRGHALQTSRGRWWNGGLYRRRTAIPGVSDPVRVRRDLDGERLAADQLLVGQHGVDPRRVGRDVQRDAVGDGEVGVTAACWTRRTTSRALPSCSSSGVRSTSSTITPVPPPRVWLGRSPSATIVSVNSPGSSQWPPASTRSPSSRQLPGLDGADDVLGVPAEARPERRRQHLQHLPGDGADVVGQGDVADVDLVGDDLDERRPGPVGVGDGHRQGGERLADPPAVGLAHRQRRRAHVAHVVHRRDQVVVSQKVVGTRPVAQVHTAPTAAIRASTVEPAVDLVGDERQQRHSGTRGRRRRARWCKVSMASWSPSQKR